MNENREQIATYSSTNTPTILGNLIELQHALESEGVHRESWVALLQEASSVITERIRELISKNFTEWDKDGMLPDKCSLQEHESFRELMKSHKDTTDSREARRWKERLDAVVQKALLRTLQRPPTRRSDIYDQV